MGRASDDEPSDCASADTEHNNNADRTNRTVNSCMAAPLSRGKDDTVTETTLILVLHSFCMASYWENRSVTWTSSAMWPARKNKSNQTPFFYVNACNGVTRWYVWSPLNL